MQRAIVHLPKLQKKWHACFLQAHKFHLLFVLKLDEELVRNARGTKTARGTKNGP